MFRGFKTGLSFGVTSGVITTLGLLVGLATSTQSKIAVVGGVLTIALVDSLSDSLGMHISQESQHSSNTLDLWSTAFFTLISKLVTALTFIVPIVYLDLFNAVLVSVFWGLLLITILSYFVARSQRKNVSNVVLEHLIIGIIVTLTSAGLGNLISMYFS